MNFDEEYEVKFFNKNDCYFTCGRIQANSAEEALQIARGIFYSYYHYLLVNVTREQINIYRVEVNEK